MDGRIQLALRIITEQEAAPRLDIREVSSLLMISETHLLPLFKREVGTAFRRYQCELRIARAVELLLSNSLSIKEVAFATGYGDISNFCRDFKHIRRLGPSQWKSSELNRHPTSRYTRDDQHPSRMPLPTTCGIQFELRAPAPAHISVRGWRGPHPSPRTSRLSLS